MVILLALVPYILVVVVFVGAIVDLQKDWDEYKSSHLKVTALVVVLLVSVLTLVSLYQENTEKENSQQEIKRLEAKADAANGAQVANTLLYITSFEKLNGELNDLKTQVKTDALQKQLTGVRAELEATQKALAPGPKAVLAFTFWPFFNPQSPRLPVLANQARFSTNEDGSYHVEFTVVNLTDVDAVDGEITLLICDACKFAKEPPEFSRLNGQADNQRNRVFQRILARSALAEMAADIIAPANQNFIVGMNYRCHTCVLPSEPSVGTVLVTGSLSKQAPSALSPIK